MRTVYPAAFAGALTCPRGQLLYEWERSQEKLRRRAAKKYAAAQQIGEPAAYPLFQIVAGGIEAWEITKDPA